MTDKTTIEISLETWRRLNQRKRAPSESFDDVIDDLLAIANGVEESELEVEEYLNKNSKTDE